jgi:hypothetical protein
MAEESWRRYSTALNRLLQVSELRSRFEEDIDDAVARDQLHVSPEIAADLKRVLLLMSSQQPPVAEVQQGATAVDRRISDAERFFETTFLQIRRASVLTGLMSGLIFLIGVVFLLIAATQAVEGAVPETAIALAASGLGAIAVAFYRSPVQQIRASSAEMQKSNMVLMSYMLGLDLIGRSLAGQDTRGDSARLTELTHALVAALASPPERSRRSRRSETDSAE